MEMPVYKRRLRNLFNPFPHTTHLQAYNLENLLTKTWTISMNKVYLLEKHEIFMTKGFEQFFHLLQCFQKLSGEKASICGIGLKRNELKLLSILYSCIQN